MDINGLLFIINMSIFPSLLYCIYLIDVKYNRSQIALHCFKSLITKYNIYIPIYLFTQEYYTYTTILYNSNIMFLHFKCSKKNGLP